MSQSKRFKQSPDDFPFPWTIDPQPIGDDPCDALSAHMDHALTNLEAFVERFREELVLRENDPVALEPRTTGL